MLSTVPGSVYVGAWLTKQYVFERHTFQNDGIAKKNGRKQKLAKRPGATSVVLVPLPPSPAHKYTPEYYQVWYLVW